MMKSIVEELWATDLSFTQICRAPSEWGQVLTAWRELILCVYRCVILDAQYEKVRQGGQVPDAAVQLA